ncbi:hypothetical protein ElyMa_001527000 [Elysia marginata]|uniref:Uncharacterized protein n=1 Tax=Elysia marginata TaxID=1093978 RepID=A0AAV4J9D0_9GAST|nr:hypothetical protein ElyMa_001527000 [Elysia marginata]
MGCCRANSGDPATALNERETPSIFRVGKSVQKHRVIKFLATLKSKSPGRTARQNNCERGHVLIETAMKLISTEVRPLKRWVLLLPTNYNAIVRRGVGERGRTA